MSLIKEDWERVYLTDEIYLKEMEWQEREHYYYASKPPARITMKKIKKQRNKEKRCLQLNLKRK